MLRRRGAQEVDERERELLLFEVDPERLADAGGVADEVEHVVLHLERHAHQHAEPLHPGGHRLVGPREDGPQQAADGRQRARLAADDFVVGGLVERKVVAILDLQQLALAQSVGRVRDGPRGPLGRHGGRRRDAAAQVVAVADQVVAEQDRGLVAAQVVDRGPLAPKFRLVQHVVVDERAHVHHLDDRRQGDEVGRERRLRADGLGREQQEHRPEHFPAKAGDVPDEPVDARQVADELLIEDALDLCQLGRDRRQQAAHALDRGGGGAGVGAGVTSGGGVLKRHNVSGGGGGVPGLGGARASAAGWRDSK